MYIILSDREFWKLIYVMFNWHVKDFYDTKFASVSMRGRIFWFNISAYWCKKCNCWVDSDAILEYTHTWNHY